MAYKLLEQVNNPGDLKKLPEDCLPQLCAEARQYLLERVSETGGHLGSNLGVVELTVGIHRVFDAPRDKIIFDVGHQCYTHKLLTGRRDQFRTLRQQDGLSGFLRPEESEYDCVVSGHSSCSVSAALGFARARTLRNEDSQVVCVIGDGALTGGMAYEAMNDAGQSGEPMILVVNDNEMSINRNVGALAKRLTRMRSKSNYLALKWKVKKLLRPLPGGERLIAEVSSVKYRLRAMILKETIFELLGFKYLGPADGNDVSAVIRMLNEAKAAKCPVVVHFKTRKGCGYAPAEAQPEAFHGVGPFDLESSKPLKQKKTDFSAVFGRELCRLAQQDERICAVSAAMVSGTGLSEFDKQFPTRMFDVGIAEEHAVTMASGLAGGGMLPVCALYSTFLQRGFDQMLHDVALAKRHVVFGVDRAGLVGADGMTHQGTFDLGLLRSLPGFTILAPSSFAELRAALEQALYHTAGPVAIRYPRGGEGAYTDCRFDGDWAELMQGDDLCIVTWGVLVNQALKAAELLQADGISVGVLKLNRLHGLPQLPQLPGKLIIAEECAAGALGAAYRAAMPEKEIKLLDLGDGVVPEGTVDQQMRRFGIDAEAIIKNAKEMMLHG